MTKPNKFMIPMQDNALLVKDFVMDTQFNHHFQNTCIRAIVGHKKTKNKYSDSSHDYQIHLPQNKCFKHWPLKLPKH